MSTGREARKNTIRDLLRASRVCQQLVSCSEAESWQFRFEELVEQLAALSQPAGTPEALGRLLHELFTQWPPPPTWPGTSRMIPRVLAWQRGEEEGPRRCLARLWCDHLVRLPETHSLGWFQAGSGAAVPNGWDQCPMQGCHAQRPS